MTSTNLQGMQLVEGLSPDRVRATGSHRRTIVPRLLGGLPLLVIGVAHLADPGAPMRPLVEAAGFPLAGLLSPVAVAAESLAGLSLLLGFWARIGGLFAIPTMLGAIYAHLVIGVWPNGAEREPPLLLPVVVLLCAVAVVRLGAGRWSVDRHHIASRLGARRQH